MTRFTIEIPEGQEDSSRPSVSARSVFGASWERDGTIYFAQYGPPDGSKIFRVPASGGTPKPLSFSDIPAAPIWGELLPGGRAFLMAQWEGSAESNVVSAVSLDRSERKPLLVGGNFPQYVATGQIVYEGADALFTAPFDRDRLEIEGPSVAVAGDLLRWRTGFLPRFAVSEEGSLVYIPSPPGASDTMPLRWVSRDGESTRVLDTGDPNGYLHPRLSPDGRYVVLTIAAHVSANPGSEPTLGAPETLFGKPFVTGGSAQHDVDSRGRFLMIAPSESRRLHVVLHWLDELR